MNVLQIAHEAADDAGLRRPSSVSAPRDATGRRSRALLNTAGRLLTRERNKWGGGWTRLNKEYVFRTVPGRADYELPSDYQAMVARTAWDRDTYYELRGPLGPQEWQHIKSGLVASATLAPRYRVRGSQRGIGHAVVLDPTPTTAEELVLEYNSSHWLRPEGGSPLGGDDSDAVVSDTDTPLLDAQLVKMSLLWRLMRRAGLDYALEEVEYDRERRRQLAEDPGRADVSMSRGRAPFRGPTVPETGFGGVR